ncbi:ABC transporter substrate-binding protein [Amycolatopsis acidicola]|uniref:ABC transporter substrate-binding protein n=1 Tax=Amycolatopsis acidicola TaxID=2596893 RepID=A0A5N0VIN1_9PSEU|nr:ABC transporter substrate-binding protein [Amycolatopsis acidicola]KAA9166116.1 ABC transporter substrate-binding protein [Amycolatopsis acidicola]
MFRSPSRWARLRLAFAALIAALVLAACGAGSSASRDSGDSLTVQLSWFSNAQNGGWTTAQTQGYLAQAGLSKVSILPGGPNVSGIPLLAAGRADIAVTTAESYLQAKAQGLPVIAVYNEFDVAPTGVLVKKSTGWTSWADLAGKSWTVAPASLGWQWVQHSQGLQFTTQNFNGTYNAFFAEPDGITQGYPTNTVYEARKQNIELNYFSYASAGFNPYGQVLVVTEDYAKNHADTLRKALSALSKGWTAYLTDVSAAAKANEQMVKDNNQLAADTNWFTWAGQRPFVIGSRGGQQMGAMAADRWATTVDQMKQIGALPASWNPGGALFDNTFLPADTMPDSAGLPDAPAGSFQGPAPAVSVPQG